VKEEDMAPAADFYVSDEDNLLSKKFKEHGLKSHVVTNGESVLLPRKNSSVK